MKKALIQIHLAVLLWGFTGVLGRAITLSAPVLVWYRMLLTALFIAAILLYRKQWVKVPREGVLQMALIGGLMGLHWIAFYAAIKYANASIALICLSTASIFTSSLDPLFNKGKYDVRELLMGLLALAGVYLIYRYQQTFSVGIIYGVIAAILSSIFTMLNKKIANTYPARTMVFYEMSTGLVVISLILPFYLISYPDAALLPKQAGMFDGAYSFSAPNDWLWLVIMALCCTVWAQSLALSALKHISSFTATLSVNLEPVYGIILAFVFFNENNELNSGFFWGMGLICLSVVLQTVRILRPQASPGYLKEKGGLGD